MFFIWITPTQLSQLIGWSNVEEIPYYCNLRCSYCSPFSDSQHNFLDFSISLRISSENNTSAPHIRRIRCAWRSGLHSKDRIGFASKLLWIEIKSLLGPNVWERCNLITAIWVDNIDKVSLQFKPFINTTHNAVEHWVPTAEHTTYSMVRVTIGRMSWPHQDPVAAYSMAIRCKYLPILVRLVPLKTIAANASAAKDEATPNKKMFWFRFRACQLSLRSPYSLHSGAITSTYNGATKRTHTHKPTYHYRTRTTYVSMNVHLASVALIHSLIWVFAMVCFRLPLLRI